MNSRKVTRSGSSSKSVNSVASSLSETQDSKSMMNNSLINEDSNKILNVNFVERELECQICLSPLKTPVLLACNCHSLCFSCFSSLFDHQKKEKSGYRNIACPTCGNDSGVLKVKKVEDLKVNRELERVQKAYEKERAMWIDEKLQLEIQLNSLKAIQEQENEDEDDREEEKEDITVKGYKRGLSFEEEKCLKEIFDNFEIEKLKEAKRLVLEQIKKESETLDLPDKGPKKTTSSKKLSQGTLLKRSKSQNGIKISLKSNSETKVNEPKRKNVVTVETIEEKAYPLRSLKKLKTYQY